jgi:hypothetical protein
MTQENDREIRAKELDGFIYHSGVSAAPTSRGGRALVRLFKGNEDVWIFIARVQFREEMDAQRYVLDQISTAGQIFRGRRLGRNTAGVGREQLLVFPERETVA